MRGTITLQAPLQIEYRTGSLAIVGIGAQNITISGGNKVPVFFNSGDLTLQDLTVAEGDAAVHRAGALLNGGTLLITHCTFTDNHGDRVDHNSFGYGGIDNEGAMTITDSTFSNNSGRYGGAIGNFRTLTVINSIFSNNSSVYDGGGIFNEGTLTVSNSLFSSNYALGGNTCAGCGFGGGIFTNYSKLTVTGSTFVGNTAEQGEGIANRRGTVSITNSTFSNNEAANIGYGYESPSIGYGSLTVTNSTVWSIVNKIAGGQISLQNSIVGRCESVNPVTASGHNLIRDPQYNCGITSGNGLDPLLGPLADNGGRTPTHALLPGSPAIDAGDPAICAAAPVNNLDQRGIARPQGSACDIGAMEMNLFPTSPGFGGPSPRRKRH